MSRLPWNIAVGDSGLQVSSDMEVPPRTLSSEEVQSSGDHGLRSGSVGYSAGQNSATYLSPPKIDIAEKGEAILKEV